MKLPNFLIIGVQKAGTTSLYYYLKQHPQIYMSAVKETNFLERDWSTLPPEVRARKKDGIDSFEKYAALFENAKDELAIGEASPNYLFHHDSSIDCIRRYVPDAKLIAILRNPIDRAYSDYLMHVRDAIGQDVNLSDQLKLQANSSFTLRKGRYYSQLSAFIQAFGEDQVKVYLYDDLCKDPIRLVQNMYRFIGVDDTFCPDISQRGQVAQVPKVRFLNNLLRQQNPIRGAAASVMKLFFPANARQQIRSSLIKLNSDDKKKLPLTLEERQQLLEYYRDDIINLQDLIHRDLSSWLKSPIK